MPTCVTLTGVSRWPSVAHALTDGKPDFQSISSLVAARYLVRVTPEHSDAARQLLAQLTPALQK